MKLSSKKDVCKINTEFDISEKGENFAKCRNF